jgi:hypothetical protein
MKIADIIRAGLVAGKTNEAILADVMKAHPEANTNIACVNWYRSKAKKEAGDAIAKAASSAKAGKKPVAVRASSAVVDVWSLGSVKMFNGRDGQGFSANLFLGATKVAEVVDEAHGGVYHFHWFDRAAHEKFAAYVKTQPAMQLGGGETVEADEDCVVSRMVTDIQLEKEVKKLVKGIALVTLEGKLMTSKQAFTPAMRADITKKFPGAVIINELSMKDAVARLRAINDM